MAGNNIRAGGAIIEIGEKGLLATQKKLELFGKSFDKVGQSISSVGTKLMAMGGGALAGFGAAMKIAMGMGDRLQKMSEQTNISVESLSGLEIVAGHSGMELEDLAGSLNKLEKNLAKAGNGGADAQKMFEDLGMSWQDMLNSSPDTMLEAAADAISKIKNPTQQANAAMELFGKSGASLLPFLKNGSAGIKEMKEQAVNLGVVLSSESVADMDNFGDSVGDCWQQIKTMAFHLGSALLPILKPMVTQFQTVAKSVIDWVQANQPLIQTVAKVAAVVFGVGVGLVTIGTVIGGIGSVFGIIASIAGTLGTALGVVGSVLGGLGAAFGFLFTIPGLLVAAVGAAIYFSGAFDSVFSSVSYLFTSILADAKETFGGIATAISNGDISGAMSILVAFLKLEWVRGKIFLAEQWDNFLNYCFKNFPTISTVFVEMVAVIRKAWAEVIGFLEKTWNKFRSSAMEQTLSHWVSSFVTANPNETWMKEGMQVAKWRKEGVGEQDINQRLGHAALSNEGYKKRIQSTKDWDNQLNETIDMVFDDARKNVDKENAAIDDATNKSKAAADAFARSWEDRIAKGEAATGDELAARQDELNAAKQQLNQAKEAVMTQETKLGPDNTKGVNSMPKFDDFATTASKVSSAGTFSAFAVNGMAGNNVEALLTKMEKHLSVIKGQKNKSFIFQGADSSL